MRISEHRTLPGPNVYSPYPTAHMLLNLEEHAEQMSNTIPNFVDRLVAALPSLREHRCSEDREGGFIDRLREGTLLGHVVEHVAIELQCLAGIMVGFGRTRETKDPGVYRIVYRYREERSGLEAGRAAVEVVEALIAGEPVDVDAIVDDLEDMAEQERLGPSTQCIVAEARRRNIPVLRLDRGSYIQLGYGAKQQRIQATLTGRTSIIGCEIADDKDRTKEVLGGSGIPVPRGIVVTTVEGALEAAEELRYPVVLKPLVGNHGRGITTSIVGPEELQAAFPLAKAVHRSVLVEQHLVGSDHRVLVIDHKFVAAARRDPANVVGDGTHTVQELIDIANQDPRRGHDHERSLTMIKVDEHTLKMLVRQGSSLQAVPPAGQRILLKGTANISTGGEACDVTSEVCPEVRAMCERASRIVGLDVMGLDIVAPTLSEPLEKSGGAVVEVNAAPGIRMHLEPSQGKPRNIGARIIDMLFPEGGDARIPIVAVTGTNGKTTTVRLISHILRLKGGHVGLATTGGVELDGQQIMSGDYSGPDGARQVLRDPGVDHAVLEVARGGILRRGLGFDACDVGVFLNIGSDHLGEGGIDTLDDLAEVKAVVVESVRRSGTAVLNAEDPRVARWRDIVRSNVTLFALDPEHPIIQEHVHRSGMVVTVSDGMVVLRNADGDLPVAPVANCPITYGGKAKFNVQNILAAVAATTALGVPVDTIRAGVESFQPSPQHLPGRLNLMEMGTFRVLVDYGHNVPALEALAPIVSHLKSSRAISVSSCSGNRRDEDIRAFGRILASLYEHVVLCDPDPRGRPPGESLELVREGCLEAGMPEDAVTAVQDEPEAIRTALQMAKPGDLVVLQVDDVPGALRAVEEAQRVLHGEVDRNRPRRPERAPTVGGLAAASPPGPRTERAEARTDPSIPVRRSP